MFVDPRIAKPTKASTGSFWLEWYKDLKTAVGKKQANNIFLQYWAKRGNADANTHDLRTYLSANGIDLEKGILSSLYDTGSSIVDGIEGFFGGFKWVALGLGVVVVGGVMFAVVNVARRSSINYGAPRMA